MLIKLFMACLGLAWLIPNHYLPWLSAWNDAVAITGLLGLLIVGVVRSKAPLHLSVPLSAVAALCLATIVVQAVAGKILFTGDAWIAGFYVVLWIAAAMVGRWLGSNAAPPDAWPWLLATWTICALVSVAIALVQWTDVHALGIYAAPLAPDGRPFANFAQPNHLCTAAFVGLCALLWLFETRRVSAVAVGAGGAMLLVGMVLTQSRTGWLQIGLLAAWLVAMRSRTGLRVPVAAVVVASLGYAALVASWPLVTETLWLAGGRDPGQMESAGNRWAHWRSMVDAVGREPLFGYGWQQVGLAQQRVALDHPGVGEFIEHSHNILLDLAVWNGLPVALVVVGLLGAWWTARVRACRRPDGVMLLALAGGILVHALLEYPLEYAYFLIPLGLVMGALESMDPGPRPMMLPRVPVLLATAALAAMFAAVVVEYFRAEENFRTLRIESARIGSPGIVSDSPGLVLLTQVEAYLSFARTEARTGMSREQLDWMRRVSERYGYPPVLFRYALAAGLNGDPASASLTLARLCRIHVPRRCEEALEGWEAAVRGKFPVLAGVELPSLPPGSSAR